PLSQGVPLSHRTRCNRHLLVMNPDPKQSFELLRIGGNGKSHHENNDLQKTKKSHFPTTLSCREDGIGIQVFRNPPRKRTPP
ncbi:hypothetical protein, partial [Aquicoccus porphyridii]|uniref:hypothetical protein n=1 Tax=Aquicoccus porphyridii TaxID=1852029 RepID=UPI00273E2FA6